MLLECGWSALERNIATLISDAEEALHVFGPILDKNGPFRKAIFVDSGIVADNVIIDKNCLTGAKGTAEAFVDAFDDLSIEVTTRLCAALGLTGKTSSCLAEQYFIDGIHVWMCGVSNNNLSGAADCNPLHVGRSEEENVRLVVGCGVDPVLVADAVARSKESKAAPLADFVIDLVLPEPPVQRGSNADWLISTAERQLFAVNVDNDDEVQAAATQALLARKRSRELHDDDAKSLAFLSQRAGAAPILTPAEQPEETAGAAATGVQVEEEMFLSSVNVDHLMMTSPELLPKYVVREKRRLLDDPAGITAFEAERHYTMAEVRDFMLLHKLDITKHTGVSVRTKAGLAVAVTEAFKKKVLQK